MTRSRSLRTAFVAALACLAIQIAGPGARLVHESRHISAKLISVDGALAAARFAEANDGSPAYPRHSNEHKNDNGCGFCAALVQLRSSNATAHFSLRANLVASIAIFPPEIAPQELFEATPGDPRAPPSPLV